MIILASLSPRRTEILKKSGLDFIVVDPKSAEIISDEGTIYEKIEKIALDKALNINKDDNDLVIAADTIVYYDNEILGKPKDYEDALKTLNKLNNNTHSVITAVAIIYKDLKYTFYDEAIVKFKNNSKAEIQSYLETKESFDKAGSYAIQGLGNVLVDSYEGDFDTIVGLPLKKLLEEIKRLGYV